MKHQQLSRTLRPEGMNRVPPIDPVEHVGQLRRRDSNHAIGRRWPDEAALLQPFGVQRHAETVMPKNLDQVTSATSKDVEIAGMRIAPHIGSADRQPDPYARGNRDHRRSSTSSTRRNACASTPLLTRIRYLPATSISIASTTGDGGVATASCSAVTITGISCGTDETAGVAGSSR